MTSCFVYKVMGLTFHDRINTQLIYRFKLAQVVARRITKPQRKFFGSNLTGCSLLFRFFLSPTKSERYSLGVVRASVRPSIPSVRLFRLSGNISQYLLIKFDSFLVQMISTIDSRYPISLVKIDPLSLELLPLF